MAVSPTAAGCSTSGTARKHVASRTTQRPPAWNTSTLLQGDAVAAVQALKVQDGLPLQVIGSADLLQALHAAAPIDEYNVWTYPVVLGRGKRLFEPGARAGMLRHVNSRTPPGGATMNRHAPRRPPAPP